MQGIKKMIPAFAVAFAIMAMPASSAAISSATDPEPWGEFSLLLLGLGLVGSLFWVKRPQLSESLILIARKRQRR